MKISQSNTQRSVPSIKNTILSIPQTHKDWELEISTLCDRIFPDGTYKLPQKWDKEMAQNVARAWYDFSFYIPTVLCQVAAVIPNSHCRVLVIETLFEEMGSGNPDAIHSELFRASVAKIGIQLENFPKSYKPKFPGFELWPQSYNFNKSPSYMLGLILGLEAPANENIAYLATLCSTTPEEREILWNSPFFKIHQVVEDIHIKRAIENYFVFCKDINSRNEFINAYQQGIKFWEIFWSGVKGT